MPTVPATVPFRDSLTWNLRDFLRVSVQDIRTQMSGAVTPTIARFEIDKAPNNLGDKEEYGIIYPLPGGQYYNAGMSSSRYDLVAWSYQITSVGYDPRQVEALAGFVREVMVRKTPSRHFQYTLTADYPTSAQVNRPAPKILNREIVGSPGGVDREGSIYSVNDTYLIKVSI